MITDALKPVFIKASLIYSTWIRYSVVRIFWGGASDKKSGRAKVPLGVPAYVCTRVERRTLWARVFVYRISRRVLEPGPGTFSTQHKSLLSDVNQYESHANLRKHYSHAARRRWFIRCVCPLFGITKRPDAISSIAHLNNRRCLPKRVCLT